MNRRENPVAAVERGRFQRNFRGKGNIEVGRWQRTGTSRGETDRSTGYVYLLSTVGFEQEVLLNHYGAGSVSGLHQRPERSLREAEGGLGSPMGSV